MILHLGIMDRTERPIASRTERRLVPGSELLRLVNNRMSQLSNSGACRLGGVLRLSWPDDDGCNWRAGGVQGVYAEEILQAIRETQERYNLEDRRAKYDLEDDW